MSNNQTIRSEIILGQSLMYYEAIAGISICSLLLVFVLVGLAEKRKSLDFRKEPIHRALLWITCLITSCVVFYSLQFILNGKNFTGNEAQCSNIISPWTPFMWVLSKQFLYFFLYERAMIIHVSLRIKNKYMDLFRYFVAGSIIFGIVVAFYWSFWVLFKGRVLYPEGCCVMITTNQAPLAAFAVADIALSSCMLFLFAFPLHRHLQNMRKSDSTKRAGNGAVLKVIIRNLCMSGLAMLSTFISLLTMDVLLTIAHNTDSPRELDYLQVYSALPASLDLLVSCGAALSLTSFWKPRFLMFKNSLEDDDHHMVRSLPGKSNTLVNMHSNDVDKSSSELMTPVA